VRVEHASLFVAPFPLPGSSAFSCSFLRHENALAANNLKGKFRGRREKVSAYHACGLVHFPEFRTDEWTGKNINYLN
jgi:hypothetical protein